MLDDIHGSNLMPMMPNGGKVGTKIFHDVMVVLCPYFILAGKWKKWVGASIFYGHVLLPLFSRTFT
jgi:hypothetical protein